MQNCVMMFLLMCSEWFLEHSYVVARWLHTSATKKKKSIPRLNSGPNMAWVSGFPAILSLVKNYNPNSLEMRLNIRTTMMFNTLM